MIHLKKITLTTYNTPDYIFFAQRQKISCPLSYLKQFWHSITIKEKLQLTP
jgi:hypothetical protein